jgi:hypothetical protein
LNLSNCPDTLEINLGARGAVANLSNPLRSCSSSLTPDRSTLTQMNLSKMIDELRTERKNIVQAIMMFERMAAGRGKRRGRPPAWMAQVKRRGRPPGSKNKARNGA